MSKASKTEMENKDTNIGTHCPLGTSAIAGVTTGVTLVQRGEQDQREDLSAQLIPERWAQGIRAHGLGLRNTFQL